MYFLSSFNLNAPQATCLIPQVIVDTFYHMCILHNTQIGHRIQTSDELSEWHSLLAKAQRSTGISGSWFSCDPSLIHKTHPSTVLDRDKSKRPHGNIIPWNIMFQAHSMLLNQIWISGILRPDGNHKLFIMFLELFLSSFEVCLICKYVWTDILCQLAST